MVNFDIDTVNSIIKEVEENKTHYKIAVITLNYRTANGIKRVLKGKSKGDFIGVYDEFVQKEIITPFMKDVYDDDSMHCIEQNLYKEGLKILKNSKVAEQYLKARYSKIYVDEFYNASDDMDDFFTYIKSLGIKIFISGNLDA